MEEEADLALLDQHLLKTNALSQRMTSILSQLDTRLSRLDKSIAPLGLQPLTRKAANIDAAIASLSPKPASTPTAQTQPPLPLARPLPHSRTASSTSSNAVPVKGYSLEPIPKVPVTSALGSTSGVATGTATPADETAILSRGPDIMALGEYFNALDGVVGDLERMWKGLTEGRGGAREAGIKDLSKLVEVGFEGLVQLFLKMSKDGAGRTFDPDQLLESGPPTPPNYLPAHNALLPLTTRIDKLLGPATPTPKTESVIIPMFENALSEYGAQRGDWICSSLEGMVSRVEEIDEGGIWEAGRGKEKVKGLVGLWDVLLVVTEAETLLIDSFYPNQPPPFLLSLIMSRPLALVQTTLQPTFNTIKRAISSHTFVALDLYQSLLRVQTRWDTAINKCLSMTQAVTDTPEARNLQSALNTPITTLRGLVSRSFPEFLVDIRTARSNGGTTSAISETTHSTLTFLENVPAYEKTIEGVLSRSQSERSWLMGAKDPPCPARNAAEEGGIVNLYVADVLGTLLLFLDGRARPMRRPIGQAFLLNNLSHIRNTTSSFNSDIIGPGAEDMLNKAFRSAKNDYLAEWTHLVSLLQTTHTPRFGANPLGSSDRANLKEGATAFFDRLTEMERLCAEHPLNRQDPDMRDRVAKEVEDLVTAGYRPFWNKGQGKGLEKYLRGSPDDVARRIHAAFR